MQPPTPLAKTLRLLAAAAPMFLLAACASYSTELEEDESTATPKSTQSTKQVRAATAPAAPSTGGEGYYLDDGPPQHGQLALADIPNAVVKPEKILKATTRPYVVLGRRYIPFTSLQPYRKRGIASWYGKRYHGRKTASGEPYDMFAMSAAHPILPIPSYVRVTRVSTGESVIVRINDRGPFLQGREIDLSYVAAAKLGIVQAGTGEVIVETILPAGAAPASGSGGRVEDAQPKSDEVFIQVAAFKNKLAAEEHLAKLSSTLPPLFATRLSIYKKGTALYAVQIGPYTNHTRAAQEDDQLCQQHNHCGFLTKRY